MLVLPAPLSPDSRTKPAAGRQQRHGFEDVGLAHAILARKQNEAGIRLDQGRRVRAEVGEGEAADGHRGGLEPMLPHAQHADALRLIARAGR
jgi:hypothetical protein